MFKRIVMLSAVVLMVSAVPAFAYPPVLYANGSAVSPVSGDQQDAFIHFDYNKLYRFHLLAEFTPWNNVNRFGIAPKGLNPRSSGLQVFNGPNSPVLASGTYFTPNPGGLDLSLYLHNDLNYNRLIDGTDSYLVSERAFTQGSAANEHQWFFVYDRRAFGSESYFFNNQNEDWSGVGNYEYLIFIDDDHTGANWDHNDMIVGVTTSDVVPEPATLILLGTGLVSGAAFARRRRKS